MCIDFTIQLKYLHNAGLEGVIVFANIQAWQILFIHVWAYADDR